jgi:hypothetical protein
VQTFPQLPQLLGSLFVFTQAPPQRACWVGQPTLEQAPATQASPAPHLVPQAPQFWKLVCVSMHRPPQSDCPTSQVHVPALQICPPPQTVPHPPQFEASLFVSTQLALHSVRPVAHPAVHLPALQTWFEPQAVPQVPQFFASAPRSTQAPLQAVVPASHTQLLPLQISPPPQAVPQAPQCWASLARSTQPPVHVVSGAVQVATHCPS